jgi:hypothetical protein
MVFWKSPEYILGARRLRKDTDIHLEEWRLVGMDAFGNWSEEPGLKAHFNGGGSLRWTEVQLPLLKQGAPSERQALAFFPSKI